MEQRTGFTPLDKNRGLRRNYLTGFTLLELLIVITLIVILAGIAITRYGPVLESGRQAEARAVLTEIVTAEKRYYLDNDSYTATITNLDSFSSIPSSTNFAYSVLPAVTPTYAQAARAGAANDSYCMRIDDGCFKTCAGAASCDCSTCP